MPAPNGPRSRQLTVPPNLPHRVISYWSTEESTANASRRPREVAKTNRLSTRRHLANWSLSRAQRFGSLLGKSSGPAKRSTRASWTRPCFETSGSILTAHCSKGCPPANVSHLARCSSTDGCCAKSIRQQSWRQPPARGWSPTREVRCRYILQPTARPPDRCAVEITVRERIFAPHRRNLGYLHVRGFTMEHCANQFPDNFWKSDSPQAGALGCRAGHHWLIENNTVRFAKSIGIDCGYEGRRDLEGNQPTPNNTGFHILRNNVVVDNGCCGIAGMRSTATKIVGNVIQRNNLNHHLAPEMGGIKVHYFVDGVIDGNLVTDNEAYGIWLDNVDRNARVTRNLVVANRGAGIFIELGEGPVLVDNNVVANTRASLDQQRPGGDGIYSVDASGINVINNLVFGSDRFGAFHQKLTQRPRASVSEIKLLNNIFINNKAGRINLPLAGLDARNNRADHNLFGPGGDVCCELLRQTVAESQATTSRFDRSRSRTLEQSGPHVEFQRVAAVCAIMARAVRKSRVPTQNCRKISC